MTRPTIRQFVTGILVTLPVWIFVIAAMGVRI